MVQISIDRRTFLKTACLFGAATAANAFLPLGAHSNVSTLTSHHIDVHHHIVPSEYVSALAEIGVTGGGGVPFPNWSPQRSLDAMDRNGIATAITSISSPGVYFGDNTFAQDLARRCNEFSANLINEHPTRFGAFAVLPLPDVDRALREAACALDTLKLDGIVLLSNVGGRYLGDPEFDELFDELNRRKAVVYIHPTDPPEGNRSKLQIPSSLIEFVFDTTRAVANLVYSGTLERCPDIRFIIAHAGGTAPYLAWRISLFQYQPAGMLPQGVITYLKRLYYDTALSAVPYALQSLQELVDPSHILFGTDYPFAPESVISFSMKGLKDDESFDDRALKAIAQENALRLFPRLSRG